MFTTGGQTHENQNHSTIEHGDSHVYDINVSASMVDQASGLKVTLVWDDAVAANASNVTAPKLTNNLGLILEDPNGGIHFPWSLDIPYDITVPGMGPHQIEPEPITAQDFTAARRDSPNDRDNVEQVLIDDVSISSAGVWRAYVSDNGLATPSGQDYSIIISPVD